MCIFLVFSPFLLFRAYLFLPCLLSPYSNMLR
jgi:hypothetical protein